MYNAENSVFPLYVMHFHVILMSSYLKLCILCMRVKFKAWHLKCKPLQGILFMGIQCAMFFLT